MKILQGFAEFLADAAKVEVATAKFILATLLLLAAIAVPAGFYFVGKAVWASQPGWLKWLILHL